MRSSRPGITKQDVLHIRQAFESLREDITSETGGGNGSGGNHDHY